MFTLTALQHFGLVLNSGANFVIYCIMGTKYRKTKYNFWTWRAFFQIPQNSEPEHRGYLRGKVLFCSKLKKKGLKWESKCDKADLRRASVSETQDESGLEMERVASTRSHRCCLFSYQAWYAKEQVHLKIRVFIPIPLVALNCQSQFCNNMN